MTAVERRLSYPMSFFMRGAVSRHPPGAHIHLPHFHVTPHTNCSQRVSRAIQYLPVSFLSSVRLPKKCHRYPQPPWARVVIDYSSLELVGNLGLCITDRRKPNVRSRTRGRRQRMNEWVSALREARGRAVCVCVVGMKICIQKTSRNLINEKYSRALLFLGRITQAGSQSRSTYIKASESQPSTTSPPATSANTEIQRELLS